MPDIAIADKVKEEERERLTLQISLAYLKLTAKDIRRVAIGSDQSEATIKRYTREVKKLPVGRLILAEMNKILAEKPEY